MQLIGIAGKARSGKDTIAKWFGKERDAFHSAFAFPIKQAVIGMFAPLTGIGWEHFENTELKEAPLLHIGVSPRALAQALGTEFGRECVHPDVWVMMTESYLKSCQVWGKPNQVIVMSDLRFENEAEWLRRNGGVVIHVTRQGADGSVGIQGHASEAGIVIETGDLLIHNDGTIEQLHAKLAELFPQRAAA